MSKLSDFRESYPQYNDLSDSELLDGLYNKYYKDLDKNEFLRLMGEEPVPEVTEPKQPILAEGMIPAIDAPESVLAVPKEEEPETFAPEGATLDPRVVGARYSTALDYDLPKQPLEEPPAVSLGNIPPEETTTPEPTNTDVSAEKPQQLKEKEKEEEEGASLIDRAVDSLNDAVYSGFSTAREFSPTLKALFPNESDKDAQVKAALGAVGFTKFAADVFGVDNPLSKTLMGVEEELNSLLSATQNKKDEEIARIFEELKGKGALDQVLGALNALAVDPKGLLAQGAGSVIPMLATAALGVKAGIPTAVTVTGLGLASGMGGLKRGIFEGVRGELLKNGVDEDIATRRALMASEYSRENLGSMIAAGGLGILAARLGIEAPVLRSIVGKAVAGSVGRKVMATAAAEGGTEALQAGQQRLGVNLALQDEGYNVPTFQGVVGDSTLEGVLGTVIGAGGQVLVDGYSGTPTSTREGRKARAENIVIDVEAREKEVTDAPTTTQELTETDRDRSQLSLPISGRPEDDIGDATKGPTGPEPTGLGPDSDATSEPPTGERRSDTPVKRLTHSLFKDERETQDFEKANQLTTYDLESKLLLDDNGYNVLKSPQYNIDQIFDPSEVEKINSEITKKHSAITRLGDEEIDYNDRDFRAIDFGVRVGKSGDLNAEIPARAAEIKRLFSTRDDTAHSTIQMATRAGNIPEFIRNEELLEYLPKTIKAYGDGISLLKDLANSLVHTEPSGPFNDDALFVDKIFAYHDLKNTLFTALENIEYAHSVSLGSDLDFNLKTKSFDKDQFESSSEDARSPMEINMDELANILGGLATDRGQILESMNDAANLLKATQKEYPETKTVDKMVDKGLATSLSIGDKVKAQVNLDGPPSPGVITGENDFEYIVKLEDGRELPFPKQTVNLFQKREKTDEYIDPEKDLKQGESKIDLKGNPDLDMLKRKFADQYAGKLAETVAKETFQNSLDAIKAALNVGLIEKGKYTITFNSQEQSITVEDNGIGMSTLTLNNAFLGMYRSEKPGVVNSSGGYGAAKGAILGFANKLDLVTTSVTEYDPNDKNKLIIRKNPTRTYIKNADPEGGNFLFGGSIGGQVNTYGPRTNNIDEETGKKIPSEGGTRFTLTYPKEGIVFETANLDENGEPIPVPILEDIDSYNFSKHSNAKDIPATLQQVLLGNVEIRYIGIDEDGKVVKDEILDQGANFDMTPYRTFPETGKKFFTVTFGEGTDQGKWASADIYIGETPKILNPGQENQKIESQHHILSNGVFQFSHEFKAMGGEERFMFDVIVDFHPDNKPMEIGKVYPFAENRQGFSTGQGNTFDVRDSIKQIDKIIEDFHVRVIKAIRLEEFKNTVVLDFNVVEDPEIKGPKSQLKPPEKEIIEGGVKVKSTDIEDVVSNIANPGVDIEVVEFKPGSKPQKENVITTVPTETGDLIVAGPFPIGENLSLNSEQIRTKSGKVIYDVNKVKTAVKSDYEGGIADLKMDMSAFHYSRPILQNRTNLNPTKEQDNFLQEFSAFVVSFRDYIRNKADTFDIMTAQGETDPEFQTVPRVSGSRGKLFGGVNLSFKQELSLDLPKEEIIYAGVAIDRGFSGVFVQFPYKAFFVNPLALPAPEIIGEFEVGGIVASLMDTLIHEVSHIVQRSHSGHFANESANILVHMMKESDYSKYSNNLRNLVIKHRKAYKELLDEYTAGETVNGQRRFKIRNIKGSLADTKGAQTTVKGPRGQSDSKKQDSVGTGKKRPISGKKPKTVSKDGGKSEKPGGANDPAASERKRRAARIRAKKIKIQKLFDRIDDVNTLFNSIGSNNKPTSTNIINDLKIFFKDPRAAGPELESKIFSVLTPRMLLELLPKTLIGDQKTPQQLAFLRNAIELATNTIPGMRLDILRSAKPVVDMLLNITRKYGSEELRKLGEVIVKSTSSNINPSTAKGRSNPLASLLLKEYKELSTESKKAFVAMYRWNHSQIDGMERDMIYIQTRHMDASTEEGRKAIKEAVKKIQRSFETIRRFNPFFPLKRYGNFWLQLGDDKDPDKEFITFESKFERVKFIEAYKELKGITDEEFSAMAKQGNQFLKEVLGDPLKNPSLIIKTFTEQIETTLNNPKFSNISKAAKEGRPDPLDSLKEAMLDRVRQLGYLLAPTGSLKKNFLNRDSIAGASTDILRVFTGFASQIAYHRSRLKYSPDYHANLADAVREMDKIPETRSKSTIRAILNEMERRTDHILGLTVNDGAGDKIASFLTNTAFYMYLSSPSSALVNIIGGYIVGVPTIGARYGNLKASEKILKYSYRVGTPTSYITVNTNKEGKKVPFINLDIKTSYDKFLNTLSPTLRRVAQDMETDLDVSFSYDITGISEKPVELLSDNFEIFKRMLAAVFHYSERYVRTVLALSAFELEYENSQNYDKALEVARDMSYRALGDFTAGAKPPAFVQPIPKLVLQFKQYSFVQTFNLLKDATSTMGIFNDIDPKELADELTRQGVLPEDVEAAVDKYNKERATFSKEARQRLIGVFALAAIAGGLRGIPIYFLLPLALWILSDSDEPDEMPTEDADSFVYNLLSEQLGDKAAATIVDGIFEQAGLGISDRISMNLADMWVRFEPRQRNLEEDIMTQVFANAGPAAALVMDSAKAVELASQGEYARAIEKITPAAIRNIFAGVRFSEATVFDYQLGEGGVRFGGKDGPMLVPRSELTAFDLTLKGLGVNPAKVARAQRQAFKQYELGAKILRLRQKLLDRYAAIALRSSAYIDDGDRTEQLEKLKEEIYAFNRKYGSIEIDMSKLGQSLAERRERLDLKEANRNLDPQINQFMRIPKRGE